MNKLYVVEMLRLGDREKHSYVAGVFNNLKQALNEGVAHEIHRGGKYEFSITTFDLNVYDSYNSELVENYGEEEFKQHVVSRTLDWVAETDGEEL